jgi:hypothetical protein
MPAQSTVTSGFTGRTNGRRPDRQAGTTFSGPGEDFFGAGVDPGARRSIYR